MISIRRAEERGRSQTDWLDSRHTFSFGGYYDPAHVGFRSLRVINDDRVSPGAGFGKHPHRDMEILTYVLSGALAHEDSLGNGSTILPGDVQRMSAGTGVMHSEYNGSDSEPVHFLQMWILPEHKGLAPEYEQRRFNPAELRDRWRLIVHPDGRESALKLHQDVMLHACKLSATSRLEHELARGRHAWLQVASGAAVFNGVALNAGDGAAVSEEARLEITASTESELLLFDLK